MNTSFRFLKMENVLFVEINEWNLIYCLFVLFIKNIKNTL